MAIFDGHNDLLLNLWLHHREDPVSAFAGDRTAISTIRACCRRICRAIRAIRATAGIYVHDAAIRQPTMGSHQISSGSNWPS